PRDYVESYGLEFPRLRFTALRRLTRNFFAGPRYVFDSFSLFDLEPRGLFANGMVAGAEGGTVSGPGIVFMFDSRDNIFYPDKGIWSELVVFRSDKVFGASSEFTRVAFDLSHYVGWKKNVLAFNLYSIY